MKMNSLYQHLCVELLEHESCSEKLTNQNWVLLWKNCDVLLKIQPTLTNVWAVFFNLLAGMMFWHCLWICKKSRIILRCTKCGLHNFEVDWVKFSITSKISCLLCLASVFWLALYFGFIFERVLFCESRYCFSKKCSDKKADLGIQFVLHIF